MSRFVCRVLFCVLLGLFLLDKCDSSLRGYNHDSFDTFGLRTSRSSKSETNSVNAQEKRMNQNVQEIDKNEKTNQNAIRHVFRESIPLRNTRSDLQKGKRMNSTYVHEVTFCIRQQNMEKLLDILNDVSDPLSSNYGHHLTREEVGNMTSNPSAHDAVTSHLLLNSVTIVSETLSGGFITAKAPISVWEKMFNTEFFMFQQTNSGGLSFLVRAETYSVPSILDEHVESVFKTIEIPIIVHGSPSFIENDGNSESIDVDNIDNVNSKNDRPIKNIKGIENKKLQKNKILATSELYPAKIRSYYNMSDSVTGSASSTQGIFAAISQYVSPSDLLLFQQYYGLLQQPISRQVGNMTTTSECTPDACGEGNLDIQYIMGLSPVSPTTYWYDNADTFSGWLVRVSQSAEIPLIFSVSYGQDEDSTSWSELTAFSNQAIKLGETFSSDFSIDFFTEFSSYFYAFSL